MLGAEGVVVVTVIVVVVVGVVRARRGDERGNEDEDERPAEHRRILPGAAPHPSVSGPAGTVGG